MEQRQLRWYRTTTSRHRPSSSTARTCSDGSRMSAAWHLFGGGFVPSLVRLPKTCRGIIAHRNERTLERLAIAPQHLLGIAEFIGISLEARYGRGPRVSFSGRFTRAEQQTKLAYFGACLDGYLLTCRVSEFTSKKPKVFDCLTELSRADLWYDAANPDGAGWLHTKRYKNDKRKRWPAKELGPAVGGQLCCMAVRKAYELINPVPEGVDPARVPYWQLPDGSAMTRKWLQDFLQLHMARMGFDPKIYKTHSLRKGGVTAMLAAGVSLPQIQLMARWSSPNMAKLYAQITTQRSASILAQMGRMVSLKLTDCEDKFWAAYTAERCHG